jgi:hypothetical protein
MQYHFLLAGSAAEDPAIQEEQRIHGVHMWSSIYTETYALTRATLLRLNSGVELLLGGVSRCLPPSGGIPTPHTSVEGAAEQE